MSSEVCVANIGRRGIRRRMTTGIVWLVLGFATAVALHVAGASRAYSALLVVPLTMGALGVFQAREKT